VNERERDTQRGERHTVPPPHFFFEFIYFDVLLERTRTQGVRPHQPTNHHATHVPVLSTVCCAAQFFLLLFCFDEVKKEAAQEREGK
jgi:hypothetical protein